MLKVNSKKTINKLANSSFKANKLRNIFAVIAIILTTVLFTGLFTVASSLLVSMEESLMRQVGTSSHGALKYLSEEQYNTLKTHPNIKSISYSVVLGIAENSELSKRPSEIRYANDKALAADNFSIPTTGRLPQSNDELATDTIVLEHLGIPAELGQKITLEYSLGGEPQVETFTLVGFWQGDKLMSASQIWLNRGYVDKQLEGYIPTSSTDFIGKRNAEVNFSNSIQIEGKIQKVIADCGYGPDEIAYGVNWAYAGNSASTEASTILGCLVIISMIIFCGYLIISNIFYISVAKDTRFYGLLKTVGTTGKQIRFLIRKQALLLCAIGIPFGLIAGFLVGVVLTPIALSILNINVIKIAINPIVFIASALFAVLTVIISIRKASKIAGGVSPIEALRSTDGIQKSKTSTKKSGGSNLFRMAIANVSRNRKKAIMVTVSLSLSLIILNSAYSMANSFDMDKYLNGLIGSDFAVADVSHFNVYLDYIDQGTLSQDFISKLSAQNGIEQMSHIYFAEPETSVDPRLADLPEKLVKELDVSEKWLDTINADLKRPSLSQHIYGLDDAVFPRLEVFDGSIDMEKLKTGNYVIALPYDEKGVVNYYNIGDKVTLTGMDGTCKEYEVLAIASVPYNISIQHSHPIDPGFILSSDIFLRDIADKAPMLTTLEVEDNHEAALNAYLSNYSETIDQNIQFQSKATLSAEYENTQRTYKSIGIIISLIVSFIGIMNFINTIVTSIMSRKHELAMLQSIGMTNRQTETMLILEGLIYTALTIIFALTIGSALGYFGIDSLTGGGEGYFTVRFTVIPSLLCLPLLAAISALVPFISQHIVNKNSIVERLREAE